MKKPNGYGSVYKLKDSRRRRPWAVRKTIGWTDDGRPRHMFIGFYETRVEAENALALYNSKPYDAKSTLGDVADQWLKDDSLRSLRDSSRNEYVRALSSLSPLMDKKIGSLKLADMQEVVSNTSKANGAKIKIVLGHIFDYAIRHEILTADRRDLVRYIETSDVGKTIERRIFTKEEIDSVTDPRILILLFTGLRVGEFCNLDEEDIHLEERWLYVKQSKTSSGVRIVPIAERIVPCFEGLKLHPNYKTMNKAVAKYNHRPHDTRHTFVSLCADKKIDERVIRAIVGHSSPSITESVYTHLDLSVLLDAVNLLTTC